MSVRVVCTRLGLMAQVRVCEGHAEERHAALVRKAQGFSHRITGWTSRGPNSLVAVGDPDDYSSRFGQRWGPPRKSTFTSDFELKK